MLEFLMAPQAVGLRSHLGRFLTSISLTFQIKDPSCSGTPADLSVVLRPGEDRFSEIWYLELMSGQG